MGICSSQVDICRTVKRHWQHSVCRWFNFILTNQNHGICFFQNKADQVLQQLNNRVQTLPTLESQQKRTDDQQGAIETTWDIRGGSKGDFSMKKPPIEKMVESRYLLHMQSTRSVIDI